MRSKSLRLRWLRLAVVFAAVSVLAQAPRRPQQPPRYEPSTLALGRRAPGETTGNAPVASAQTRARLVESYGRIPLSFEPAARPADPRVNFQSQGSGYSLFLAPGEAVLGLRSPAVREKTELPEYPEIPRPPGAGSGFRLRAPSRDRGITPANRLNLLRLRLLGANQHAPALASDLLPGKSNYFIGNDPQKWRTNIPNYARVRYRNVYPGIDLLYYGNQRKLEHDFEISPGADPNLIGFELEGADKLELDASGDLRVRLAEGEARLLKPVIFQRAGSQKREVRGGYRLLGQNRFGFWLGDYDHAAQLVIDPILAYSTYFGGSAEDDGIAVATDSAGNAYLTGLTFSTNFPVTAGSFQGICGAAAAPCSAPFGDDAFVAKFSPTGSLIYSTFLGGSGVDQGLGIRVDAAGEAYVVGQTTSRDFPLAAAFQPAPPNFANAFITKLNAAGSALIFSSYLGGSASDFATSVGLDPTGNAYVAGGTFSKDFPTAGTPIATAASSLFKTTTGAATWAVSDAGIQSLKIFSIAIDPVTPANIYAGTRGAGVYKSTNGGLAWGTTAFACNISAVAIDPSNPNIIYAAQGAFCGGLAKSTDGGATKAFINTGLPNNAFVAALAIDRTATSTVYAATASGVFKTQDGGANWSAANTGLGNLDVRALAIDPTNPAKIYAGTNRGVFISTNGAASWTASITGLTNRRTRSLAIDPLAPTTVYVGTSGGGVFKSADGGLTWTAVNTGLGNFFVNAVAVDPTLSGTVYAGTGVGIYKTVNGGTGWAGVNSGLTNLEIASLAIQGNVPSTLYAGAGGEQAFVSKFGPTGAIAYSTYLGGSGVSEADAIAVDSAGNAYVTGGTDSPQFPTLGSPSPLQATIKGPNDGFVSKIDPTGSRLVFSTFLGGTGSEDALGIAVDGSNPPNVYVVGDTNSGDFPITTNAFQTLNNGNFNAFLSKLNPSGSGLLYSTYLGGSTFDGAIAVAVDAAGVARVVGFADSPDFPIANPTQPLFGGFENAFVATIDTTKVGAASLLFSTYLGGTGDDFANGVAIDGSGDTYVVGQTSSKDFPIMGTFQAANAGGAFDAFLAKFQTTGNSSDVAVTMAAPSPVTGNLTYTITVTDNGPNSLGAPNVVLTDALPASARFVSATATGGGACSGTTTIVCRWATVPLLGSVTATIVVTPTVYPSITNTVFVSTDDNDPNPANNRFSLTTAVNPSADMAITMSASPSPAPRGTNFAYTLLVTNNGPTQATNVTVSDPVPATVSLVSALASQGGCTLGAVVTCALGGMNSGATATITIVVTAPAVTGLVISNTATVTATEPDPNPANNTFTLTTPVGADVDLSLSMTVSPTFNVVVGATVTYTLGVFNNGPDPTTGVVVTDALLPNFTLVSATSGQGSCSGTTTVVCSVGALAKGAATTITITLRSTLVGAFTNVATVSGPDPDPSLSDNTAAQTVTFKPSLQSFEATLLLDAADSTLHTLYAGQSFEATAPIKAGAFPRGVAISPNGRLAFVADNGGNYISVVDISVGAEVTRIRGVSAQNLALNADGSRLVLSQNNQVTVLDATTFQVLQSVAVANPGAVVVGNRAYLNPLSASPVTVVDLSSFAVSTVSGSAVGNAGAGSSTIAATPDGNYVLALRSNPNTLLLIKTATNAVAQTLALASSPSGIAVARDANDPKGVFGYLLSGNTVNVVDLRPGSPTFGQLQPNTSVTLPFSGSNLAINADGTKLTVITSGGGSSNLAIVNLPIVNTGPLTGSFRVGGNLMGIASGFTQNQPHTAAPRIDLIQPTQITDDVANLIHLYGQQFAPGALVRIGNLDPTKAAFVSAGQLDVTVPAGAAAQLADIIVILPNPQEGVIGGQVSGILRRALQINTPAGFQPPHPVISADAADNTLSVIFKDAGNIGVGSGSSPLALAISPDGVRAYAGSFNPPGVAVVNLNTDQQEPTIPLPGFPGETDGLTVAPDPVSGKKVLFAVSTSGAGPYPSDRLSIIDVDPASTTRNTVLRTISTNLTDFGEPRALAATPDGRFVYSVDVSTSFLGRLVIFDVVKGTATVLSTTTLNVNKFPPHIHVTPDGKSLLMPADDRSLKVFDISVNPLAPTLVTSIGAPLPNGSLTNLGWFQVVGTRLFIYGRLQGLIEVYNFDRTTPNFSLVTTFGVPGAAGFQVPMVVTPDGSLLYAGLSDEDNVAVIDVAKLVAGNPNPLITKIRTGLLPDNLAVSPLAAAPVDLGVTLLSAFPNPSAVGGDLFYNIQVTNHSANRATGVVVTDTLPAGVTLKSAEFFSGTTVGQCGGTTTITCNVGALPGINSYYGNIATVFIQVTPNVPTPPALTDTVSVSGNEPDPNPVNNSASVSSNAVGGADLAVTLAASANSVAQGSNLTYTLVLTNKGPDPATGVSLFFSVTATGSTNLMVTASLGTCTTSFSFVNCTLSNLAAGASATLTIVATANTTFPFLDASASVSSTTPAPNSRNNSAELLTPVVASATAERYLLADRSRSQILAYNASDDSFASQSRAGSGTGGIAVSPNGRLAFTANVNADYLSVLDLSISKEIFRIHGIDALNVALTADGKRLVATSANLDEVAIVDTSDFHIINRVSLNGKVGDDPNNPNDVQALGIAMVGSRAYISAVGTTVALPVIVVDANTFAVSTVPGSAVGFGAPNRTSIAATPDGKFVLAVQDGPPTLLRIDTSTNTVAQQITLPSDPDSVVITPNAANPNGVFGYVSSGPVLTVVDLRPASTTFGQFLPNVTANIGIPARVMALNSAGTRLYAIRKGTLGSGSTLPSLIGPAGNVAVVDTGLLFTSPATAVLKKFFAGTTLRDVVVAFTQTLPSSNAPTITGLDPTLVVNNAPRTVRVLGTNFDPSAQVRIGSMDPMPATFVSSTEVQVTIPQGAPAGDADIVVTLPFQQLSGTGNDLSGFTRVRLQIVNSLNFQPAYEVVASDFGESDLSVIGTNLHGLSTSALEPLGLAFSPDGQNLYVESFITGEVSVINPAFSRFELGIPNIILNPFLGQIDGIAAAGSNPQTGKPAAFVVSPFQAPNLPPNSTLADEQLNLIDADSFSPTSNTVVGTQLANLNDTDVFVRGALAVTPDGRFVYSNSQGKTPRIVIFDVVKGAASALATSSLAVDSFQSHIHVTPDGKSLLLASNGAIKVFDIGANPTAPSLVATITGSAPAGVGAVTFTSFYVVGARLFALDGNQNVVEVFNFDRVAGNFSLLGSFVVPGTSTPASVGLPSPLAVTPDGSQIYAGNYEDDNVAVLDAAKVVAGDPAALITRVHTGTGPIALAVNPVTTAVGSDLAVSVTHSPEPVPAGANITYSITVKNNGPLDSRGGGLIDILPAGLTFVSLVTTNTSLTCQGTSSVACSFGNFTIPSGGSLTFSIVAKTSKAGTAISTVGTGSDQFDPNPANNFASDTATVVGPDLALTMLASTGSAPVGGNLSYTLAVVNNGPGTSTGITLTDALPAGVVFVSATGGACSGTTSIVCNLGSLNNGAGASVIINVTGAAAGTFTNTASVTNFEGDPKPANDVASVTTQITGINPVPSLSAVSFGSAPSGSTLILTGASFVSASTARWNGSDRVTTYVSGTGLTAALLPGDVLPGSTATVTVFTPAPGGGTSNSLLFKIGGGSWELSKLTPSSVQMGSSGFMLVVQGVNFKPGLMVQWNGQPRFTAYVGNNELHAAISASDVAAPGTVQVSVADPATGQSSHALTFNISDTLLLPRAELKLTVTPASATVSSGQSATLSVAVATSATSGSAVQLSCADLPQGMSCSFAPPVLPASQPSAASVLTISTGTALASASRSTSPFAQALLVVSWLPLAGIVFLSRAGSRRLKARVVMLLSGLLLVGLLAGCGGGRIQLRTGPATAASTPAGTYQITVLATSANGQTSTTVSITVR